MRSHALEADPAASAGDLSPEARPTVVGPYLQDLTANSAIISWETDSEGATWIEYGPTPAYGMTSTGGAKLGVHQVHLADLKPATSYHYRVLWGSTVVSESTFQTPDPENRRLRFAVYGDTQANAKVHRSVSEAILTESPAFVLHVGDEVQNGDDYESWATEFFSPARALMSQVPVYAALGNHEHNAIWFYYYHAYPDPENYYSFESGSNLIVVLDSNTSFAPGGPQQTWLRQTLESDRARGATWVWVTFHHPAYAGGWSPCNYDGEASVREQLLPVLERYGVDAVFNGHVHGYERGMSNGVYHVTTGGGGGTLDYHCADWSEITTTDYEHHYVVVDSDEERAIIKAKRIDGSIIDQFTISRRLRAQALLTTSTGDGDASVPR